ncbi:MAG: transposase [Hylemonella sp.]|uniref:REP-associated tyrosine transposase n=1 Tax=Hylemonella sp. TaxID=2066020 RepID=UPI0022C2BCA5|nr:transposase [Hylemonella sp.]MCZ8253773.1 transposase [Hylemonella sp.]
MARLPRLSVPGYPHHVIQRGNNRQAIFLDQADRQQMLDLLELQARQDDVAIHAYVLMDNHLHLLVTPQTADGLSHMMQAVGRRYVRSFNDRHGRSGTLWEGRYKSTLVETERYLLACMCYIDLNPVRAGLVGQARDYAWSSHGHYAGLRSDRLISPHPLYWELGNTPFAREAAYARLVQEGLSAAQQQELTDSVLKGWALGSPAFIAELQKKTDRRLSKARAGRPATR